MIDSRRRCAAGDALGSMPMSRAGAAVLGTSERRGAGMRDSAEGTLMWTPGVRKNATIYTRRPLTAGAREQKREVGLPGEREGTKGRAKPRPCTANRSHKVKAVDISRPSTASTINSIRKRKREKSFRVVGSGLKSFVEALLDIEWKRDDEDYGLLLTVDDTVENYNIVNKRPEVWFNHFDKNSAITTKGGLARNIQDLVWSYGNQSGDEIFPRCYMLSTPSDINAFQDDYRATSAASIVRGYLKYGDVLGVEEEVLKLAIKVCEFRITEYLGEISLRRRVLSAQEWELINQVCERTAKRIGILSTSQPSEHQNHNLLCRARRVAECLEKRDPQWKIDGFHNTWIIKPADKSKGVGVLVERSEDKIIRTATRMGGARIVQKYVENPQLGPKDLKIDLRVWVLVTSWEPLVAWVYDPFYCRICSKKFSLNKKDLSDNAVHLCNFSIQKHDEYLTQAQLLKHLRTRGKVQTTEDEIRLVDKVHEVCKSAIRVGQNKVVHRDKSFELYGVDLLLDTNLNVWLLEVNLSPGLKYHDDSFKRYVEEMARQMYGLVLHGEKHTNWKSLFMQKQTPYQKNTCGIKFLLQGRQVCKQKVGTIDTRFQAIHASQVLARFAQSTPHRWPKVRMKRLTAAVIIQALVRMKLAKNISKRIRASSCLQKCWRRFWLRRVAANTIQHHVRFFLSKLKQSRMLWRWVLYVGMRHRTATKINNWIRLRKAIFAYRCLVQGVRAVKIQSFVRQAHARAILRRKQKVERMRQEAFRRRDAARTIKLFWRVHKMRKWVFARRIQAVWKAHRRRLHAVPIIQACWRSYRKIFLLSAMKTWLAKTQVQNILLLSRKLLAVRTLQQFARNLKPTTVTIPEIEEVPEIEEEDVLEQDCDVLERQVAPCLKEAPRKKSRKKLRKKKLKKVPHPPKRARPDLHKCLFSLNKQHPQLPPM